MLVTDSKPNWTGKTSLLKKEKYAHRAQYCEIEVAKVGENLKKLSIRKE